MVADPSTSTARPRRLSAQLAAGAVQVPHPRVLDHGLEVLLPDDAVLHRVLDDGPDEPGRDVVGADDAVAEVRGQRRARWSSPRSPRRSRASPTAT